MCAYAYIAEDYTKAVSILKNKNGTKNSCELVIEELSYDSKEKILDLENFYVNASTFLGSRNDGTEIGEGMEGSRADIVDFSEEHNSVLIDLQTRISNLESRLEQVCFNDKNSTKGGNLLKFEELLKKYNVKKEDIDFDYEGLSDGELEAKFKEKFEDTDATDSNTDSTLENQDDNSAPESNAEEGNQNTEQNPDAAESTTDSKNNDNSHENPEESDSEKSSGDDSESDVTSTTGEKKKKKYSIDIDGNIKSFEVALDDKIFALSNLVNTQYGESDNCWYSVKVYEKYLVMSDYWTGIAYKQTYSQDGDNFSLTGDRVEVFATYLTQEELNELDEMRNNYAALVEYKSNAEFSKLHSQREEILSAEKYAVLKDTDEFKSLVENMDKYNLVDLEKEAKVIFADYITSHAETFSAKNPEKETKKKFNGGMRFGVDSEGSTVDDEKSPYGDYFKSLKK